MAEFNLHQTIGVQLPPLNADCSSYQPRTAAVAAGSNCTWQGGHLNWYGLGIGDADYGAGYAVDNYYHVSGNECGTVACAIVVAGAPFWYGSSAPYAGDNCGPSAGPDIFPTHVTAPGLSVAVDNYGPDVEFWTYCLSC